MVSDIRRQVVRH